MDKAQTPDEKAAQTQEYREAEPDLLKSLLLFADSTTDGEITPIVVKRKDGTELRFSVRPLLESEYVDCKKRATTYVRAKAFGNAKIATDSDSVKYRNFIIYEATIDEDRRKIWDNKALWKKFEVGTGAYVVDKLLRGGEKEMIVAKIDEISGYNGNDEQTDDDLEETAGN